MNLIDTILFVAVLLAIGNLLFLVPVLIKFKNSIMWKIIVLMMILVDYVSLVLVIVSLLQFTGSDLFLPVATILYGIGLLISIAILYIIHKSIVSPLFTTVVTNKQISEGNLTVFTDKTSRNDEIGILINTTNDMSIFLKSMISRIDNLVKKLVSASHELASNAEEVNASSEELSSIASKTANLAQEQKENVNLSLNEVKLLNENVIKQMEQLKKSSELINEIQEQINILSLNASIEAARAGEYGRGFAVVAQNIKNLSEKTKETVEIINSDFQTLTDVLRGSMENLIHNFNTLRTTAIEYASQAEQAGAATEEQTATLEEITSTAQELAELSQELQEMQSKFIL